MALKPQSIRKGMIILVNGEGIPKQELIQLSENWTEQQERFFKKMLKQGGKFKINGTPFETHPPERILTSKGEQDTGPIIIPGEDSRF